MAQGSQPAAPSPSSWMMLAEAAPSPDRLAKKPLSRGKATCRRARQANTPWSAFLSSSPMFLCWHGFPWLDKSLQTSSLAFYMSVSSLRYHLRQTTLFPIAALSRAWAAVPQHAEEPDNTCSIAQQPWQWAQLALGIVLVGCNRAGRGLQKKPERHFCLNGVPL